MTWNNRQDNPSHKSSEDLQQEEYESWFKSPGDNAPGQQSLWEVTETARPQIVRPSKERANDSND